uniref:Secreted protein n=1 Tax=Rhabditophanes sp. KR3021 TaxID=114890 RepID=A0AC35TGD4_9BILA
MTSTHIVFLLAIVSLFISKTNAVGPGFTCVDQAACDAGLSCNSYKNAAGTDIFICTTTCDPALAEIQCGTGVTCANVNDPAGAPKLACALTALTSVCSITPCTDPLATCNTFNQLCQVSATITEPQSFKLKQLVQFRFISLFS